jgi:cyclophilin family peptidyl-prolyl cis-trans isomerase
MAADLELLSAAPTTESLSHFYASPVDGESAEADIANALPTESPSARSDWMLFSNDAVGEGEATPAQDLVAFAKALTAAGVKFYGADWCPVCTAQKALFQDGANYLDFIEVTNPDREFNSIAQSLQITSMPTWIFPDQTRAVGLQTLAELSTQSGIAIPTGIKPSFVPVPNTTVAIGSPLHIPIDAYDPNGSPLTVTVTSSNPDLLAATVLTGNRSMLIKVDDYGDMVFQLFEDRAPRVTQRIVQLVESGFYDQTASNKIIFHRVIDDFVIQTGDPTGTGSGGSTLGDFDDQFHPDLQHNGSGVLSFAKSSDDTNDSQFFITEGPQRRLDFNHSVFGQLVEGEAVRNGISRTDTLVNDRPVNPITIRDVNIIDDEENAVVMLKAVGNATGTAQVTVRVTNADGEFDEQIFSVNVVNDTSNSAPFLSELPATIIAEVGKPKQIQLSSTDVEGNAVTYDVAKQGTMDFGLTVDSTSGLVTVTPPSNTFTGPVEFIVGVRARDGADTVDAFDTQRLQVVFTENSSALSVDLLPESDTGVSDSDNLTSANQLKFRINGTTPSAEVILRAGNTEIARGTATGSSIDLTANAGSLADGIHSITVIQSIGGSQGTPSTPLEILIDRTSPSGNSIAPPAVAKVGSPYRFDFYNSDEAQGDLQFSLESPPAGATIDPVTGVINWTPTAAQVGQRTLRIATSDLAGNTRTIEYPVVVTETTLAGFRLELVSEQGTPLTSIAVGQTFLVNVFVQDQRTSVEAEGVFGAYVDLLYDPSMLQVVGNSPISLQTPYLSRPQGTVNTPGIVDEMGAFSSQIAPLGPEERLLARVQMRALRSGAAVLAADPADISGNTILLYDVDQAIPTNQVSYGSTSIPIRSPFTVANDSATVAEDSANNVLNPLANDTIDPQSNVALTITAFGSTSAGGSVQIIDSGSRLQYTPVANFSGTDVFTYTARDQYGNQQTGTMTVNVSAVNDPPTAVADAITISGNSTNNVLNILSNDLTGNDPGDTLTIRSVGNPSAGGSVTITNNATRLTYTPRSGFVGTETFTYTIRDTAGAQATATVTITVTTPNPPPTAVNDAYTVTEDAAVANFPVVSNDSTSDVGETIQVSAVGTPSAGGTVQIVSDGQAISYRPAANFSGTETVTYTLRDSGGATATATVTFTVTGVNDPPVATADTIAVLKGSTNAAIAVLGNDNSGPGESQPLTITQVTTPSAGGAVTIDDSQLRYTPPSATFLGSDTFSYTIRDAEGLTATANVTVNVVDYVPRKIGGEVEVTQGAFSSFRNAIKLGGKDSFGTTVDLTTTPAPDGAFVFSDRAPGDYTLRREALPFLMGGQQAAQATVKSELNSSDNLQTRFSVGPVAPQYISIRDFVGRTPRQAVLVAVRPGEAHTWLIGASDLGGVSNPNASLGSNSQQLTLQALRNGQNVTATISTANSMLVQRRGVEGTFQLLRVATSPTMINYQVAAAATAEAETASDALVGESEPHLAAATAKAEAANDALVGEGEGPSTVRRANATKSVRADRRDRTTIRSAPPTAAVDAAMREVNTFSIRTSLINSWFSMSRRTRSISPYSVDRAMRQM